MTTPTDNLTKVHLDLPNHWWFKGESLWAKDLGGDLYEIQNIPFCAYGLNCGDVVRATPDGPDLKPEVRAVVKRSGNRTLRISFCDELSKEQQQPCLDALKSMGAELERANEQFVCVNVLPSADYDGIVAHLVQLEGEGSLEYETCEERVPGSFDYDPERDDDEGKD